MDRSQNDIKVPFVNLKLQHAELKPEIIKAVERVLDHGQYILGPENILFEQRFASYCGVGQAIGVDNGTSALVLTLQALGIGPGDEVITAPNSFLASASCIALSGAKPVFADVNSHYTIDPARIENAITSRTKAIIPVHLTGRPADMEPIMKLAGQNGLHVIEDCAQAVGASYRGKKVGSFGMAGCFSLHPLKVLSAIGDGGVITTNDPGLHEQLLKARNHGMKNRNECEFWSGNHRLDTLQAAILLVKMGRLDHWIKARREIASFYREHLRDVVRVPDELPHEFAIYQTFVIQADRRDQLQHFLKEHSIDTKVHYPLPLHLQPAASKLGLLPGSFPVAEDQARNILSLPMYPELTREQTEKVVSVIRAFYKN
ncbi:MAG: DegT/DnrJ/EryC1/StrS family aminotransferase [Geobacteraceae bacterium]|nr:DegT/DnrJ/EryC1/StrS family aminotransferase [Geobacteraceae bacterium]